MRKPIALITSCLLLACLFACGEAQPAVAPTTDITTNTEITVVTTSETTTETTTATTTEATTTTMQKPTTSHTHKPTTPPTTTTTTQPQNLVPKQYVGSAKSGPLSWEEYQQARGAAAALTSKYRILPLEAQLRGVYSELRAMYDAGMEYSMELPHYADPYGYLILKRASCAGSARTAGLCLDVLGIPWEHVNPGAFTHQWARVQVGSTYWICDPYGMYVGPEPAPYKHPYIET